VGEEKGKAKEGGGYTGFQYLDQRKENRSCRCQAVASPQGKPVIGGGDMKRRNSLPRATAPIDSMPSGKVRFGGAEGPGAGGSW